MQKGSVDRELEAIESGKLSVYLSIYDDFCVFVMLTVNVKTSLAVQFWF